MISNLFIFGKRKHRGSLVESLATSVIISEYEFTALLNDRSNNYHYCFDNRCNQILFLGNPSLEYDCLFIEIINERKLV